MGTSFLPRFLQNGKSRKLKDLARDFLHLSIQEGSHDPLEDARAAMRLYKRFWNIPGAANPICYDNRRRSSTDDCNSLDLSFNDYSDHDDSDDYSDDDYDYNNPYY